MKTNLKALLGVTTILTLLTPLAALATIQNADKELQTYSAQHLEISNALLGIPEISAVKSTKTLSTIVASSLVSSRDDAENFGADSDDEADDGHEEGSEGGDSDEDGEGHDDGEDGEGHGDGDDGDDD